MRKYILQKPTSIDEAKTYPLWVVLHGAYDYASQAIDLFGAEAKQQDAYLLAPQASRACGDGYCWSFARDAAEIKAALNQIRQTEYIDQTRISLIGFSMGCTMGCWVLAQHPQTFRIFAALSMGSAFEPWEFDDGGIDFTGLRKAARQTQVFLAVDRLDPYGSADYFEANLAQFRDLGFQVDIYQPNQAVHAVTKEMKAMLLPSLIG